MTGWVLSQAIGGWLLVFNLGTTIATRAAPEPLSECLKWQCRMKPEQRAVCIRVIDTPMGPFVERERLTKDQCAKAYPPSERPEHGGKP